ncbi:hypothetical protein [Candidatus Uabimicrobium sp. HlEnr_7]|uniref:hypothetical protein n=1 Tax=Candidatus Uabimicrobium helgolandensis TaxID=3095367 RepID=UPI00355881EB
MKYVVLLLCIFTFIFSEDALKVNIQEGVFFQDQDDDEKEKREVRDENKNEDNVDDADTDDDDTDDDDTDDDDTDDDDTDDDDTDDDDTDDDDTDDADTDDADTDDVDADDDDADMGDDDDDADMDDDDDEVGSGAKINENSPLKIEVVKIDGAVTVGQQIIYTVTITNIADYEVNNVKLVLNTSFGIDPVEVFTSATSLIEDGEEEGILFEPLVSLKSFQAIEYQVSCDVFNFYRGEDNNYPISAIVLYEQQGTLYKKVTHGKHFEVVAAPYLETNIDSEEGFVDTGQELNYEIEIVNIGPLDAEKVVVLITYDAQQLQIEDIAAPTDVTLHSAGRIKFVEFPLLKAEDLDSDEQQAILIKIKGKAMMSGYASGLHVISKVSKKQPVKAPELQAKKEELSTVKTLKLRKATFKERKNNNRRWDIGWKKGVLPDSFVVISIEENGTWVKKFTSQVMKNNLRPIWEIDTTIQLRPEMKLQIEVYDKDLKKHDTIGTHTLTIDDKIFSQQELEFSFAGVEKIYFSLQTEKEK